MGGENSPNSYTDARYHYRVTGPGPVNPRADGTAGFVGEDEVFEVSVVQGSAAADPMALAQSQMSSLGSTSSNFQITFGPARVEVGTQEMVKVLYTWTGKSRVSGQQIQLKGVHYYLSKDPSTVAVIRYEDAAPEFDLREADGFANSFRWL
jgi:hypothetical protein